MFSSSPYYLSIYWIGRWYLPLDMQLIKKNSYSVFRRVVNYYSDDPSGMSESGEDAYDMRKPCSRDKKLEHVREKGEDFLVSPEDVS